MLQKNLWTLFLTLTFSSVSHAGWVSGGGELIKDSLNPWFISSENQISYCYEKDEKHFSLNNDSIRQRIRESFEYWQREFQNAPKLSPNDVLVETTSFVERDCSAPVDLKFQFGRLTEKQREFIQRPQELVGISVRQSYNLAELKGRGFIYIAPDSGPLLPNFENITPGFWSQEKGTALKWVLIHELGHVFGLPHGDGVMSKNFSAQLVGEAGTGLYVSENFHLASLSFRPSNKAFFRNCDSENGIRQGKSVEFFEIPEHHLCRKYVLTPDNLFKVYSKSNRADSDWTEIGSARMIKSDSDIRNAVSIYLTTQQSIFPDVGPAPYNWEFLHGKETKSYYKGLYKADSSEIEKEFILSITPDEIFQLIGNHEGQLFTDLETGL